MSELDLYKFIHDNKLEIDWRMDELILWVDFDRLYEFTELIGYNYMADGGINVNLQSTGIALNIVNLCEYFGIEPENILTKEDDTNA